MTKKCGIYQDKRCKKKPWACRWFEVINGKQKRFSKGFKLKSGAEAYAAEQTTNFRNGVSRVQESDKCLRYLVDEFMKIKQNKVGVLTLVGYADATKRLLDYFGPETLLVDITIHQIENFVSSLRRHNPLKDTGETELSSWTVWKIIILCKTVFSRAVVWEWLKKNPFAGIEKPKRTLKEWQYLSLNEYQKLIDAVPLRWKVVYSLAYRNGLRNSEIFSLKWDAIWFDHRDKFNGTITLQSYPTKDKLPPFTIKGSKAAAKMPLAADTVELLSQLRAGSSKSVWNGNPYICQDDDEFNTVVVKYKRLGKDFSACKWHNNTGMYFAKHLKAAGIERDKTKTLTLHTLRKCAGRNWACTNVNPNHTRQLMRHEDIKTTLTFYDTVDYSQIETAQRLMDDKMLKARNVG